MGPKPKHFHGFRPLRRQEEAACPSFVVWLWCSVRSTPCLRRYRRSGPHSTDPSDSRPAPSCSVRTREPGAAGDDGSQRPDRLVDRAVARSATPEFDPLSAVGSAADSKCCWGRAGATSPTPTACVSTELAGGEPDPSGHGGLGGGPGAGVTADLVPTVGHAQPGGEPSGPAPWPTSDIRQPISLFSACRFLFLITRCEAGKGCESFPPHPRWERELACRRIEMIEGRRRKRGKKTPRSTVRCTWTWTVSRLEVHGYPLGSEWNGYYHQGCTTGWWRVVPRRGT